MLDLNVDHITYQFKKAQLQHIDLIELITDAGTQQRAKMNTEAVENYSAAITEAQSTEKFPPLKIVELNESHTLEDGSVLEKGAKLLVDGFHRTQAALEAGYDQFQAIVAEGSYMDAVYFSMQANRANGLHLAGKDYQNAIKRLYKMTPYWREHGRKQEIAKLFGCSTKTVQRAVASIDKDIKAKAFKMFEMGAVDSYVAEFAHKDVVTIHRWREEWEQAKLVPEVEEQPEAEPTGVQSDPMELTFNQVLKLSDLSTKTELFNMLKESLDKDRAAVAYKEEKEAVVVREDIIELARTWNELDCWEILGKDFNSILACKNPRGALQRQYVLQLSKCETEDEGANPALDILEAAYEEAKGFITK